MTIQAAQVAQRDGIPRAFEAGWLVAAVLVPAAIMHQDFMLGFIQMPKVFVLQTAALYLVAVFVIEWAMGRWQAPDQELSLLQRWRTAVDRHPARLIIVGAAAVLFATLVSIAFAPVKSIAIWGIDPGWDTYGLVSLAAYLVIFAAVATHLRTGAQLRRLVWALTAVSIAISLLSVGQHFGIDPFRSDPAPAVRARSTFGNPLFAASYLLMTVPLTITLFTAYRDRFAPAVHVALGAALVALQFAAVLFSLSRGPWIGFVVLAITSGFLLAWMFGSRVMLRAAAIASAGLAIGFILSSLPVPGVARGSPGAPTVIQRIETVMPAIGEGVSSRAIIWRTAADVYLRVPWVDTEAYPEIPGLGFRPLRRIVGFGPDHFGYAYLMAGEATYTSELAGHAHSFFIHTMIELGFLGFASYAFIFGALVVALRRMVRAARAGAYPEWFALLVVGLSGALAGRVIEQIAGKAQISDLALSWMLAAVVVAMSTMRFDEGERVRARPRRRPRGRQRAGSANPMRVAGAAAVVAAVIAFWSVSVVPYVVSARVGLQADQAARRGEGQLSLDLYTQARDIAPDLAVNRLRLAQALFSAAGRVGGEERAEAVQLAYGEARAVLDRNPLDHRAWSRAGGLRQGLAALTGGVSPSEALRDGEVLAQIMPGFWQIHAELAWSYVRLGGYEEGFEAVTRVKELNATGGRENTYLVL
ncbi:MAG: O-antigen ligase family protein, partial [Chloroflexi bacterium]|nr:O-antigen ligase family protein [Chloroflexota bacterium]